jgi:hypothetical protein
MPQASASASRLRAHRLAGAIVHTTDHGGTVGSRWHFGRLGPQGGSGSGPALLLLGRAEIGEDAELRSVAEGPARRNQAARRLGRAAHRRQPWHDLAGAQRQQVADKLKPAAHGRAVAELRPVELGGLEGRSAHWDRDGGAGLRRAEALEAAELVAPALAHRIGKLVMEVAEIEEGPGLAPFLAHEHKRHLRGQQQQRQPRLHGLRLTRAVRRSPNARLPIWSWFCTKLTKRSVADRRSARRAGGRRGRRTFALVDIALGQTARASLAPACPRHSRSNSRPTRRSAAHVQT